MLRFFGVLFNLLAAVTVHGQRCGGLIRVPGRGSITVHSEGFPAAYPPRYTCQWFFRRPVGVAVKFTAKHFELEHSARCHYDYLSIAGTRFCGTRGPVNFVVNNQGGEMKVEFVSDSSNQFLGFSIIVELLNPIPEYKCGGQYSLAENESLTLTSPEYPSRYPEDIECTWVISAPAGRSLKIMTQHFEIPGSVWGSDYCDGDYLEIGLATYCGTNSFGVLAVDSPLTLKFVAGLGTEEGELYAWSLEIETIPLLTDECGGHVDLVEGQVAHFVSPRHPGFYSDNTSCSWTVTGPADKGIIFNAIQFAINRDIGCKESFLSFYESGSSQEIGRFCGKAKPKEIRSLSNRVEVRLVARQEWLDPKQGLNFSAEVDNCPGKIPCPLDPSHCLHVAQFCDGKSNGCPGDADELHCSAECGIPAITPNLNLTQAQARIFGGAEAVPHSWPWQIAMITAGGLHFCGGSLIERSWIMTAAHCCVGQSTTTAFVRIGAHDQQNAENEPSSKIHSMRRIVPHPWYKSTGENAWDFCLLELEKPVDLSPEISPVCLATDADSPVGSRCFATGWGKTNQRPAAYSTLAESDSARIVPSFRAPHPMLQTDIFIWDQAQCQAAYGISAEIDNSMICAGAPDHAPCDGDSGGPLVCLRADGQPGFVLVGETSFGPSFCVRPDVPSVFGRIATVKPWIIRTIFSVG